MKSGTSGQLAGPDQALAGNAAPRQSLPGWAASVLLHLAFILIVFAFIANSRHVYQVTEKFVPVSIVQLGEKTVSPEHHVRAAVPQQKAASPVRRPTVPAARAPARRLAAPDSLEARLRTLSHLKQTNTNLPVLDNEAASDVDATSDDAAPGSYAAYSVKDYIRTQVERRWTLNLNRPGARDFTVAIRIEVRRNGTIDKAEIIDKARFASNAAYRDAALSARNAVLLSSPIALPAGPLRAPVAMTLRLDPKDVLR